MYTIDELADELNRQEWAVERMLKNRGYLKQNGDPRKSTIDDGYMNKNGLITKSGWEAFIDELGYKDSDDEDEEEELDEENDEEIDDEDDEEEEEDLNEKDDEESEEDDDENPDEDEDDDDTFPFPIYKPSHSDCMFDRNGICLCEDSPYCENSCIGTCDWFYR